MVKIVLTIDADAHCDDESHFAKRSHPCFEAAFVVHVAMALKPRAVDADDRHLARRTYSVATRREPFRFLKRQA